MKHLGIQLASFIILFAIALVSLFIGVTIGYQLNNYNNISSPIGVHVPESESDNDSESKEIAFASFNDFGWIGGWLISKNPDTGQWEKDTKITNKYIVSDGIILDTDVYLNTSGNIISSDDWSSSISSINVLTKDVTYKNIDGYLVNLLKVEDNIYAYRLDDNCSVDAPRTLNDELCGAIYVKDKINNTFYIPEKFNDLPGAKGLIAYNPTEKTFLLSDGYGDGPCVWSSFHEHNVITNETEVIFSSSACKEEEYENYNQEMSQFDEYIKSNYLYSSKSRRRTEIINLDDGNVTFGGSISNPPKNSYITELIIE